MASVTGFMYCDVVQPRFGSDGRIQGQQISLPLTRILVKSLPTEKSFTVAFCLDEIEADTAHELKVVMIGPDGGTILNESCKLEEKKVIQDLFFSIDIRNLGIVTKGKISTELYLDNEKLGIFPIIVAVEKKDN